MDMDHRVHTRVIQLDHVGCSGKGLSGGVRVPEMFEIPLVNSILVWSTTYKQSHKTNWSPCEPPTLKKESFGQWWCFCIVKIVVKLMPTADWQHSNVIDRYVWANTPAWTILWCVWCKGEHECTHGWPGSIPVGLHTFKIETQICVSNKVQVTRIHRSSTRENTSTCHLIKKSDTNRIWTSSLLHLRPVTP